ncbi:hypothetical protein AXK56_10095 [Tsukamurella pulmonis]|uniref:DUF4303 domain-containing protein n=1 Tax=Tsukamurella pulmonis TaxID=47312 RepID=A0A1H1F8W6_9ACTN|nr:hypothetical protein [Tsukamurella pulmonis]KXO88671.1 hypothetical protein AXK56_10095 [Tsukamurella pulmonis]SDQ97288.1 hypothetical protein SAMN04489765_2581 [Tsukamurella pulmonis]SUP19894.1 Uncharacterised protein [Tsukamurella pulmonis]
MTIAGNDFDWFGFEDAIAEELRTVARALVYQADGELPYAYALTAFHAEAGGPIDLPHPALGTVESVAPRALWNPPAWPRADEGWSRRAPLDAWQDRLTGAVDGLGEADWNAAYARYGHALLAAMRRAKAELVAEGAFPTEIACLLDDDGELLARSATPRELRALRAARGGPGE